MLEGQMMDRSLLIIDILKHAAETYPAIEIVSRTVEGPVHRYGYRDAFKRTAQLAHALKGLGIEEGDRVATIAWNTYRHFELYYGVSGIGAVCHTINPRLFEDQLEYIVNHADDRVIFVDANLLPLVEKMDGRFPGVKAVIVMTDRAHMPETKLANVHCYEELLEGQPETYDWPELDERAASAMCYTSGTTGNPKGSLYSHRSTVLHAFGLLAPAVLPYGIGKAVLPVVPMFHVQAWGQPYAAPIAGTKLVMPGPKLDGESLFELMEDEGVTLTLGVPTIWMGLLTHLRETGKRFTHLTHLVSGGAAIPLSMIKAYEEEFGLNVVQGWGMTETSPVCCAGAEGPEMDGLEDDARHELKLRERKFFGVDLRLVDEDGGILPHDGDTPGELQCRGPWVINGYYNDAEATAAAMTDDGWFRTGDVATLTDAGLLQITDRTKDLIKSGGEWISSIDLENEVMSHPGVAEAAAIAMPHPKWQERPMLVIVAHEGKQPSANELRAHLADKIVSWWMPDDIAFVDELPHTATGKVSKLQLRERFKDHVLSTV
ncbi:MAG: long-chain fatty acid--CoA ligase [Rhodospirillaceae bacterium]|jgi:3-(methylthio)propionyl---CoA ligase|nr:long-chain fatty acid--CoA ligase [Rhodospirillaceae bacterium]MBT6511659.1 long-chain fatty acid--CoA ligase [Rhodospirillaceae bacterium]MBT7612855.1 long-chain fatty acid--CoA ligase [Rhodospirillaceae bacterium]MBT7646038.1 long-chain fatty acid--CoA ligase [Rhodospirillaceae bacterium]